MVMHLDEVVNLCALLTSDAWKYDNGHECKYSSGKLYIVSMKDNYLSEKEIIASYDDKQFLWYKENHANSKYVVNPSFEAYVNSKEFISKHAKLLLLK